MGVQRAMYEVKAIPLTDTWAYKTACENFGDGLVESFPRFSRGPRKGSLKGYLCYIKTTVGGWAENLPVGRGVLFPGTSDWDEGDWMKVLPKQPGVTALVFVPA